MENSKKEIKNNEILSNYSKELEEDIKLNEFNLREKSLTASSIWAKWIKYLFLEKENLQRINDAKQKILKNKISNSSTSILRIKSEDKLSENDETIKKLNILNKQTQDCIDFIERALNILQNFSFNIKNVTEILKLQLTH